jgi:hypothetical protein
MEYAMKGSQLDEEQINAKRRANLERAIMKRHKKDDGKKFQRWMIMDFEFKT